jgi:hypothetical protein
MATWLGPMFTQELIEHWYHHNTMAHKIGQTRPRVKLETDIWRSSITPGQFIKHVRLSFCSFRFQSNYSLSRDPGFDDLLGGRLETLKNDMRLFKPRTHMVIAIHCVTVNALGASLPKIMQSAKKGLLPVIQELQSQGSVVKVWFATQNGVHKLY